MVQEQGVQVHPKKFWFVENSGKIPENSGTERSFDTFVSYWVINESDWIKQYKSLKNLTLTFFSPKKIFVLQKKKKSLHV